MPSTDSCDAPVKTKSPLVQERHLFGRRTGPFRRLYRRVIVMRNAGDRTRRSPHDGHSEAAADRPGLFVDRFGVRALLAVGILRVPARKLLAAHDDLFDAVATIPAPRFEPITD